MTDRVLGAMLAAAIFAVTLPPRPKEEPPRPPTLDKHGLP